MIDQLQTLERPPVTPFEGHEELASRISSLDHDVIPELHEGAYQEKLPLKERVKIGAGKIAVWSSIFIGFGAFGAMTTDSSSEVGPHKAGIRPTADGLVTFKVPSLGSVIIPSADIIPSASSYNGGAHITLGEIPDGDGIKDGGGFSDEFIQAYASFFNNPGADKSESIDAIWENFLVLGTGGLAVALYASIGFKELARKFGDREKIDAFKASLPSPHILRSALAAGILVLGSTPIISQVLAEQPKPNVGPQFKGTILENATVEGKLMQQLVINLGGKFLDFLETNNQFYTQANNNLNKAFTDMPNLFPGKGIKKALVIEGVKCANGVMPLIGTAADKSGAFLIINAGDSTIGGTWLEGLCVRSLANSTRGIKKAVADGNHDSDTTQAEEKWLGFIVLDGKVVIIDGFRLLGDDDPRLNALFTGAKEQKRKETIDEMSQRLADTACSDKEGVDIIVTNQPGGIEDTVDMGCAKLAIVGGIKSSTESYIGRETGKIVVRHSQASTGGATFGEDPLDSFDTLGPLQAPAEMTIFGLDEANGEPLYYQTIIIGTDASATISPPTLLPYALTPAGQKVIYGK